MGANAFVDPTTLCEFVNFVRSKSEELNARAVVSIVPKAKVSFPQVGAQEQGDTLSGYVLKICVRRQIGACIQPSWMTLFKFHVEPLLTSFIRHTASSPQTWASTLWPYSREQDGVFVQLQALCPTVAADAAVAGGVKAGGKVSKASGSRRQQKDASKPAQGDQERVDASQLAKVWFVRLGDQVEGGGGFKVRTPHELPQDLSLMPSLLR